MDERKPTPSEAKSNRSNVIRLLTASLLFLAVAGFIVWRDMTAIRAFITENGAWGIAVALIVYAILGATIIPSEPLTILIGALFGPWIATGVAAVGNLLAALVEYYIGRGIRDATSLSDQMHKLPFGLGKLPVNSLPFLIFGRMVPAAGPKLVSFLGGLYHVPLVRYIWTTLIPTAIGAAIFAFGGWGLGTFVPK